MGGVVGGLIGLGIGIYVAKKLTDEIKGTKKKKQTKQVANDWVSNETGGWN